MEITTCFNCPRCGELIPTVAKFCRFCGHDLSSEPVSPAEAAAALKAEFPRLKPEEFQSAPARSSTNTFITVMVVLIMAILGASYIAVNSGQTQPEEREERKSDVAKVAHEPAPAPAAPIAEKKPAAAPVSVPGPANVPTAHAPVSAD